MARKSNGFKGSQLGKPSTRFTGKLASKIRSPWGTPGVGRKLKGSIGKVYGSSTRQQKPDSQRFSMDYPRNDPLMWPVEVDRVGHTKAPPQSGMTTAKINANNAAVEHAFTRAKYQ